MSGNRCTATSKQTGRRCGNLIPVGHKVCRFHGGRAPQTIAAAQQRLSELVWPALDEIAAILAGDGDAGVRLRAAVAVLDRTGFGPGMSVLLQQAPTPEELSDHIERRMKVIEAAIGSDGYEDVAPDGLAPSDGGRWSGGAIPLDPSNDDYNPNGHHNGA